MILSPWQSQVPLIQAYPKLLVLAQPRPESLGETAKFQEASDNHAPYFQGTHLLALRRAYPDSAGGPPPEKEIAPPDILYDFRQYLVQESPATGKPRWRNYNRPGYKGPKIPYARWVLETLTYWLLEQRELRAWANSSPRVEGLALPKSVESGSLSFSKNGIRWMSVTLFEHFLEGGKSNEFPP
jgi:hypothetical protein